jgi:NMD protein affecting ribosome stability and mRNA decay
LKCEKCGQTAENTVGGVCFDCIATFDDGQISRLYKTMTIDMLKNAMEKGPPKPKVRFFDDATPDVLKEQLEEFLSSVDRIISINYTVSQGWRHVMVVYT